MKLCILMEFCKFIAIQSKYVLKQNKKDTYILIFFSQVIYTVFPCESLVFRPHPPLRLCFRLIKNLHQTCGIFS